MNRALVKPRKRSWVSNNRVLSNTNAENWPLCQLSCLFSGFSGGFVSVCRILDWCSTATPAANRCAAPAGSWHTGPGCSPTMTSCPWPSAPKPSTGSAVRAVSIHWSVCPSSRLSIYPSTSPNHLSIHPSTPCIHPSICPSVHPSICPSTLSYSSESSPPPHLVSPEWTPGDALVCLLSSPRGSLHPLLHGEKVASLHQVFPRHAGVSESSCANHFLSPENHFLCLGSS